LPALAVLSTTPACAISSNDAPAAERTGTARAAVSQPAQGYPMQIVSANGGGCLDAPLPRPSATPWFVQQSPCNGGKNQSWIFQWVSPETYLVKSAYDSSLCLDLPNFSTSMHQQIQLYPCNGGTNQQWQIPQLNSTLAEIWPHDAAAVMCLDVADGIARQQATIQLFPCQGSGNQEWKFRFLVGGDSWSCDDTVGFHTFGTHYVGEGEVNDFQAPGGQVDVICTGSFPFSHHTTSCPWWTNWMTVDRRGGSDVDVTCFEE
jgi:hypothetical protein